MAEIDLSIFGTIFTPGPRVPFPLLQHCSTRSSKPCHLQEHSSTLGSMERQRQRALRPQPQPEPQPAAASRALCRSSAQRVAAWSSSHARQRALRPQPQPQPQPAASIRGQQSDAKPAAASEPSSEAKPSPPPIGTTYCKTWVGKHTGQPGGTWTCVDVPKTRQPDGKLQVMEHWMRTAD